MGNTKNSRNKVLCSTGLLIGKNPDIDYGKLLDIAPLLLCDGFELMFSSKWYDIVDDVMTMYKDSAIKFFTIHMNKNIGTLISRNENDDIKTAIDMFEVNCKMARNLNIKLAVLHLWGGSNSDSNISVNIEVFQRLFKIASEYDIELAVENIVCKKYNPLMHMKSLFETYGEKIKFTIDTRHADFHGMLFETLEEEFIWKNNLVRHIHISDFSGGDMQWENLNNILHPGDGRIDFDRFFDVIKSNNYNNMFTIESRGIYNGELDIEKINKTIMYIRNHVDSPI